VKSARIGVIGAGVMGSGIAQCLATAGHAAVCCDVSPEALDRELAQNPILASFVSALTHRFRDLEARTNASQR